ncbi:retropepsin-like aspartic protease family protein [Sulfurirhabdus autotrophica]|uniref:Aspartyl protease family protein n=1 Tax=Sulfurirhabdus autotrophica TaxID=1706046 RepID=A0A4R3XX88_9PROT|nr:TIGR02281 family clan AA aspartic protease [Sulfurirhabdus autotrophica]TCV82354.1 aspartyl protease family protein [Sulfurirhabdus autotrophica]
MLKNIHHHSILSLLILLSVMPVAHATDVSVTGLFSGKALVSINGGSPRMLTAGGKIQDGVKLISADSNSANLEIDGKRQTLLMGQGISSHASESEKPSVTIVADIQGHFMTSGSVNGASTRFLVDTGASTVSMGTDEARRLGINYLKGERAFTSTANGIAPVYKVMLNTVKIGNISLNQVEGTIIEGQGLPITLLGMSFLKRLDMKRAGTTMTLTKQY